MAHKMGVISDIHGNLYALQAVLGECRRIGIEEYLCLGDISYGGPYPAEVVDVLRSIPEIKTVRGNTDDWLLSEGCDENNSRRQKIAWAKKQLGQERFNYLKSLPVTAFIRIGSIIIGGFHASPEDTGAAIDEASSDEDFGGFFKINANLYCYGHTHRQAFFRISGMPVINPGTVGLTNAPGFIVMEVDGKMIKSIDFRQISYDAREAVNAGIQKGMPGFDAVSNIWLKGI